MHAPEIKIVPVDEFEIAELFEAPLLPPVKMQFPETEMIPEVEALFSAFPPVPPIKVHAPEIKIVPVDELLNALQLNKLPVKVQPEADHREVVAALMPCAPTAVPPKMRRLARVSVPVVDVTLRHVVVPGRISHDMA